MLDKRVASVQTLSGTGALSLTAHLIKRLFPGRQIYCSNPTWDNHGTVVSIAGVRSVQGALTFLRSLTWYLRRALQLGPLLNYRYWDAATKGLDFSGLCADFRAMPEGSVVILHGCVSCSTPHCYAAPI